MTPMLVIDYVLCGIALWFVWDLSQIAAEVILERLARR